MKPLHERYPRLYRALVDQRVGFPMSDVCPVYLHHRTCPEPVGTSHSGHSRRFCYVRSMSA